MSEIKLNSIPSNVFCVPPSEVGGNVERAHIVATGRLLMQERNGRDTNALRALEHRPVDFTCRMNEVQYAETNEKLKQKLCLFAARMAANQTGDAAPADYQAFLSGQRVWAKDPVFLRTMAGVIREIVTPILPAVTSNALGWLAKTVYTPMGKTYEVDVMSNDIFLFQDGSWGAAHSKPRNTVYPKTIAINPTPREAKVSMKLYQLIGNNADLGAVLNSMSAGFVNKVTALWNAAMVKGANDTKFMPSGMVFDTNSTDNWRKAAKRVRMVNGGGALGVVAYADIEALAKGVPAGIINTSTVNLDAALSMMLGAEYTKYGYLADFMGAKLMPIDNVVVPGTQNTTVTELIDPNVIYFAATAGDKPVYNCFEEGTPITVDMFPSETADMTVDITMVASMAAVPVFASKIARMNV